MEDLQEGMRLQGTVRNVVDFGAFVDIGVHQDGLVHISELADRFVKDPREVVKAGDVVKVRVKDVDVERKRIALSMKSDAGNGRPAPRGGDRPEASGAGRQPVRAKPPANHGDAAGESALAAALKRARDGGNRRN